MTKTSKTPTQLERHLKGIAHYKRISILQLLGKVGAKGMTLEELEKITSLNTKNLSHHATKLQLAGLVDKKFRSKLLVLSLSPYGRSLFKLLNTFPLS